MSIGPIEAIGAGGFAPIAPIAGTDAASASNGADFAAMLSGGLQKVEGAQDKANGLAVQAATGQLKDVHEYLIAANEAQLTTQLTVAVRNKAIEAFNEIMRLQA
jgi:flagellar hook-basal body complex protein FliE